MQRIFDSFKQTFRQSFLILGLVSLILSSVLVFTAQPSFAAPLGSEGRKLTQFENMDKSSQPINSREQAYEEQVKAAENPDKVYEENLKEYQEEHPGENIVQKAVEGAEKLVDKAAGKE